MLFRLSAGGPDVSPDEFGCPTCRGYTWVFALWLVPQGAVLEFSFHAIQTIELKFTIDKYIEWMVPLRVLPRTNLAGFAPPTSSISFISFRLRTLKLSCRSFSDSRPLFSTASALFLQNTRGGIPLRDLVRCNEAQKCLFVSPLPATLRHSVSRKSFPCHSYANTRDGGATAATNFERISSSLVYPERSPRRATRHSPLSCYPLVPPSHAPRSASIPRDLSRLRILPVTTGVWGSHLPPTGHSPRVTGHGFATEASFAA